jgi:hypothetical protein
VSSRLRPLRRISQLCILSTAVCTGPPASRAQEPAPIRVETRDVYVPVLVLDKKRIDELQKMKPFDYGKKLVAHELDFAAVAVSGLHAGDFRLFEDGHEQRIQSVTPNFQLARAIPDNVGLAEDFVGAGGGIWVAPGVSVDKVANTVLDVPDWPGYLIAYDPPGASDGRCHHIAVKVNRPQTLLFGRTEYCNNADPLKGTDLGKQIESDLASGKTGTVGLSATTADLFTSTPGARVQISVDFSPNVIFRAGEDCYGLPEIRILGLIYAKNGSLVARFSDFMSRNFGPRGQAMPLLLPNSSGPITCFASAPSYQTQIRLPPGKYDLRVALRDGKEFGHAEIPFTVESHDPNRLAVSGIALVKRYRRAPIGPPGTSTELPVNYEPLLSHGLELTPTGDTTFARSAPLNYYVEVFEPLSTQQPAPTVQAHVRIVDARSGEVKDDLPSFSAAPYMNAGDPVIPIEGAIDISELPRGLYRLEVQATDSTGNSTPWRAAPFATQ